MSRFVRALEIVLIASTLRAQEASVGVSAPVTVSFGAYGSARLPTLDPAGELPGNEIRARAGFRAIFYPTVKLGENWFGYAAIRVRSAPYYYYDAYHRSGYYRTLADRIPIDLLQGYIAHTRRGDNRSFTLKAGYLSTAFGAFPLRYDDMENPLIDRPLAYGSYLLVRPDMLPCSAHELEEQARRHPHFSNFTCKESSVRYQNFAYGIFPITPLGLPGAQLDLSLHRLDARIQITNSSPTHPKGIRESGQSAQWAAGAGYTIRQGLRFGASAFRGPWLDSRIDQFLPAGVRSRDSQASGIGVDAQWARGRWNVQGEWQRMVFPYPYYFRTQPAATFAYVEVKTILTPRWFIAMRAGNQLHNHVEDLAAKSTRGFLPDKQSYELAFGFRPNRHQLIKVGYLSLRTSPKYGSSDDVLGVQLVSSIPGITKSLR